MAGTPWDEWMARVAGGGRLADDELEAAAGAPDILSLGMLADACRRAARGTRVTYLRVATMEPGDVPDEAALGEAGEVRLAGPYPGRADAEALVRALAPRLKGRALVAWSLADLEAAGTLEQDLRALAGAGLAGVAEAPLDRLLAPVVAAQAVALAGLRPIRLTVDSGSDADRLARVREAREVADAAPVSAFHPLPLVLNPFRPTTGYDDVRVVALARLALPPAVSIQVDWPRYGPKLAQVALAFGADDLYGVAAQDAAPDGARRGLLLEVRRNVEAAGFEAVERDGVATAPRA